MADNREVSESVAMDLLLSGHSSGLYFCRPGIIKEFDPATNLAVVRPAIQAKVTPREGQPQYITFPTIIRVPVVIPYAQKAGLCITVPIRKGDECLLVFSDRMIDNFVKTGGIVKPECCGGDNKTSEPRQHDLTDAICIPGFISQPFKIPEWNTNAIEIRNRERTCFFSMNENRDITISTTGNTSTYCNNAIVNAMSTANVCGNGGVYLNEQGVALVNRNTGSCGCSASCPSDMKDPCCEIRSSGSLCLRKTCSPTATNNCMQVRPSGSMCVRR